MDEVKVSPGVTTVFLIHDAAIDRAKVSLEGRDKMRVTITDDTIVLLPSEQFARDQRLRLTIPFSDDAAPTSASFMLVVHPALAERQVEVYRKPRSAESLRVEVIEKDAELQRCREDVERLRLDVPRLSGLSGMIADGHLNVSGIIARTIAAICTQRPGDALRVRKALSFRSVNRVALDLWMEGPEETPWLVEGVVLLGTAGEKLNGLKVWQDMPNTSGTSLHLILEAPVTAEEARGPFTLKLWEKGGQRTLTLGNVTFP